MWYLCIAPRQVSSRIRELSICDATKLRVRQSRGSGTEGQQVHGEVENLHYFFVLTGYVLLLLVLGEVVMPLCFNGVRVNALSVSHATLQEPWLLYLFRRLTFSTQEY